MVGSAARPPVAATPSSTRVRAKPGSNLLMQPDPPRHDYSGAAGRLHLDLHGEGQVDVAFRRAPRWSCQGHREGLFARLGEGARELADPNQSLALAVQGVSPCLELDDQVAADGGRGDGDRAADDAAVLAPRQSE